MKSILQNSVACAAIIAALMAAGCSKKSANVLARVGDKDITVADFKAEYERRQTSHFALPDRQALLEQMINRETLLQQARAAGLNDAPEVRRAYEDLLIAKYKEAQLVPKIVATTVTPDEVRKAYENDLARYMQAPKAKLAFVFIAVDSKAESNQVAVAESRANDVHRLAAGLPANVRGFGQLAADFSDDQVTRYRGGDAGWFTADSVGVRWPTEVMAAGLALKNVGDITGILRANDGFYVAKKLDFRAAAVTPLAQVQSVIEHRLLLAKQQDVEKEFQSQGRQSAQVTTNESLLSTISYPTQNLAKSTSIKLPGLPSIP